MQCLLHLHTHCLASLASLTASIYHLGDQTLKKIKDQRRKNIFTISPFITEDFLYNARSHLGCGTYRGTDANEH